MGEVQCCKARRVGELELNTGKANYQNCSSENSNDPQELEQRFEKLSEGFPFTIDRVVVLLNYNFRKNAVYSAFFALISAGIILRFHQLQNNLVKTVRYTLGLCNVIKEILGIL